nr:MAG TPA: hypothetical protein [Caudoviricetes sp.]
MKRRVQDHLFQDEEQLAHPQTGSNKIVTALLSFHQPALLCFVFP